MGHVTTFLPLPTLPTFFCATSPHEMIYRVELLGNEIKGTKERF